MLSLLTIAFIFGAPLGIPIGVSAVHHANDRWQRFARRLGQTRGMKP